MKKIRNCFISVLVFAMLVLSVSVFAAAGLKLEIANVEAAERGESITIPVTITENPGFWGVRFTVEYDSAVLELTGVTNGDFSGTLTPNVAQNKIVWEKSDMDNVEGTGTFFTLTFNVLDDAAFADTTVSLSYEEGDILNNEMDDVSVAVESATITVTHEHEWEEGWSIEEGKHWKACVVAGCEATTEKTDCYGGTATCLNKAVCTVCGRAYGEYADHVYQEYNPTEVEYAAKIADADCKSAAVYCKACPTCKESTYGLYENEAKAEYIFTYGDPLPHTFTCENPEEKYLKSDADCDSAAEYYYSCERCQLSSQGTEDESTFTSGPPLGHDWAEDWTESADGQGHYHACNNGCGDTTTTYAAHTGGTATCQALAKCDVCEAEYGELAGHTLSETYTVENDQHWQECTVAGCDYTTEKTACAGTGTPTCTERVLCDTCGNPYGAIGDHTLVWVAFEDLDEHMQKCTNSNCVYETRSTECSVGENGTEATCKTPAVCGDCGQSFGRVDPDGHKWADGVSDGNGNHSAKCELCEMTKDSVACAGTGDNAPTCTEKGECDVCGYVLAVLGHDYNTDEWAETEDGQGHYHACSRCDDTTKDYAAHTGGTATCQALAKCGTCNFEYGELAACYFTKKDTAAEGALAQAATCVAPAEYYYSCSVCGKVNNAEGAATFEAGDPDTVNGHKADTAWTADDENDQHYHKCLNEGCTVKLDVTACSGGTATCTEKAKCSACGQEYGEIDSDNHDLKANPGTPATCMKDGVKAHWTCSRCDVLYAFTENVNGGVGDKITEENKDDLYVLPIAPEAHKWVWGNNETGHWEYCDYCYELAEENVGPVDENKPDQKPEEHTFGDWVTANGYKTKTCECGYHVSEKVETSGTGTGSNIPDTGDDTPIALWALVFLCSGAAAVALGLKKKEN